jgi:hypothetical protein
MCSCNHEMPLFASLVEGCLRVSFSEISVYVLMGGMCSCAHEMPIYASLAEAARTSQLTCSAVLVPFVLKVVEYYRPTEHILDRSTP